MHALKVWMKISCCIINFILSLSLLSSYANPNIITHSINITWVGTRLMKVFISGTNIYIDIFVRTNLSFTTSIEEHVIHFHYIVYSNNKIHPHCPKHLLNKVWTLRYKAKISVWTEFDNPEMVQNFTKRELHSI